MKTAARPLVSSGGDLSDLLLPAQVDEDAQGVLTVPNQRTLQEYGQLEGGVWNKGKGKTKARSNRKYINYPC